jgi:hypothetical protein
MDYMGVATQEGRVMKKKTQAAAGRAFYMGRVFGFHVLRS